MTHLESFTKAACSINSILCGFSYLEVALLVRESGGTYAYWHKCYGKIPAFLICWYWSAMGEFNLILEHGPRLHKLRWTVGNGISRTDIRSICCNTILCWLLSSPYINETNCICSHYCSHCTQCYVTDENDLIPRSL